MCLHTTTKIVLTPELKKHHAKKICSNCGKFMNWQKNPKIDDEHLKRNNEITFLLKNPINSKNRNFLETIRKQRLLTPKQQTWYNNIKNDLDKYLSFEFGVNINDWYFYNFGCHQNLSDKDKERLIRISNKFNNGDDCTQFNY